MSKIRWVFWVLRLDLKVWAITNSGPKSPKQHLFSASISDQPSMRTWQVCLHQIQRSCAPALSGPQDQDIQCSSILNQCLLQEDFWEIRFHLWLKTGAFPWTTYLEGNLKLHRRNFCTSGTWKKTFRGWLQNLMEPLADDTRILEDLCFWARIRRLVANWLCQHCSEDCMLGAICLLEIQSSHHANWRIHSDS